MPRQREICQIINLALQAGNFASRKFSKGSWSLVAYLIPNTEKNAEEVKEIKEPVIVNNLGEGKSVSYNDKYPIQFYHRILSVVPEDDLEQTFGNPGNTIKETSEMVLICIGDREKLGVVPEDVIAAIWADVPREISHADLTTLTLQDAIIIPGEVNVNPMEVFAQEFVNVDFDLAPENFILSLRYKIVCLYSKNCFKLCA